jgi:hypothetical protein
MDQRTIEVSVSDRIPLSVAQKRLTLIWFVGAFGILAIMIARMQLQDAFTCEPNTPTCDSSKPWEWWGSAFAPTLLLMVGAITVVSDEKRAQVVDQLAYRLAQLVSLFYLIGAVLPILTPNVDPSAAIENAKWVPLLQGIVTLFMGRLFGSVKSKD